MSEFGIAQVHDILTGDNAQFRALHAQFMHCPHAAIVMSGENSSVIAPIRNRCIQTDFSSFDPD